MVFMLRRSLSWLENINMIERSKDQTRIPHPVLDQAKRKRLGQYFTGLRLGRLLAILSNADIHHHIIDPMCGIGDMLVASQSISHAAKLYGIEIDKEVYSQCLFRLQENHVKQSHIISGNAFDESVIAQLPRDSFDLVITNPPYVRYQTLSSNGIGNNAVSLNKEVRLGLARIVDNLRTMDAGTREVFKTLINGYSGLSDLAVPSWLLCAMLTRVGGTLAMVVPASWLSRDYSQIIHYLLLKFFRIRWVVEDAHSIWFDDALVNTTLLIAERIPMVDDLNEYWEGQSYVHVVVLGQAMDERSVVGRMFPDAVDPDADFINYLQDLDNGINPFESELASATHHSLKQKYENVLAGAGNSGWLHKLESPLLRGTSGIVSVPERSHSPVLPQRLKDVLPEDYSKSFATLQDLGLQVGQGLRTGANRFFYVDVLEAQNSISLITTDNVFGVTPFEVQNDFLKRVLRKQSEVSTEFELNPSTLTGRVLVLSGLLLPEDFEKVANHLGHLPTIDQQRYRVMSEDLARYVRVAATANIGSHENPRYVPNLSAVKTNQSNTDGISGIRPLRYWYMLPAFAPRHIPDLFVARINHLHPRVIKNSQDKTIIDANFSTFWLSREPATDVYGFLSLLNSSWCVTAMELMGTVMGGGALKLEATHLKQLPIPSLSAIDWNRLSQYGKQLAADNDLGPILDDIDSIIASNLCSNDQINSFNAKLRVISTALLQKRTRSSL